MTWESVQLGEVIDIEHGYAFKGEHFSNSGQFVLLTPGNCHESGGLKFKGERETYYAADFPQEFLLDEGDLIVVMTDLMNNAPILGGSFIVPEGNRYLHNQRLGLVKVRDHARIDKSFLHYALNTREYRAQVRGSASGATVRHTSPGRIKDCLVPMPRDPARQKEIAGILSAYDALIENNRRRMALLEEAARQLYREWFVRLRFPGREHTRIADGVPEGWKRVPLIECAKFLSGGTPSKANADYWEGDIPWVSSGELTAMRVRTTKLDISAEAAGAGSRLVPAETILAVVRGMSLAKEFRIGLTARTMAFNQDLKAIVARLGVDNLYLFHALETQSESIRDKTGEASHGTKKLDTAVLGEVPILLPTESLQTVFREHVAPLHAQWDNLDLQSHKLRGARDLLLPRLMSGALAV